MLRNGWTEIGQKQNVSRLAAKKRRCMRDGFHLVGELFEVSPNVKSARCKVFGQRDTHNV